MPCLPLSTPRRAIWNPPHTCRNCYCVTNQTQQTQHTIRTACKHYTPSDQPKPPRCPGVQSHREGDGRGHRAPSQGQGVLVAPPWRRPHPPPARPQGEQELGPLLGSSKLILEPPSTWASLLVARRHAPRTVAQLPDRDSHELCCLPRPRRIGRGAHPRKRTGESPKVPSCVWGFWRNTPRRIPCPGWHFQIRSPRPLRTLTGADE